MSLLQSLPGRWQPWPRGPLLIMTRWQRLAALIASVLSSSPAVLLDSSSSLLFSLLLAQLPVFASASPVPPRRSSDLDRLTNHTTNLKKLAQKLLVSACRRHPPPPPPTHKQNKKQQLHDGEKVTALIDSYWGGEDSELHNSYHKSTKRIYGNSRLCIRVSNSLTDRVCSGYSKMIVLVWLHAYRVAPADLTVISLLIPIPIHYESSSDSATLCLIILTERAAFICKLNCIAIIFFFAKTCSSSHPNLRIVFNSPDFDDCNVSSL